MKTCCLNQFLRMPTKLSPKYLCNMIFSKPMQILLLASITLLLATPALAEHSVVASGLPIKKSMCDINGCQEIPITQQNQAAFRMTIFSIKNIYVWASRDKKPLLASSSNDFYHFVAPGGEGYIKISSEEGKTVYVEHMTLGFKNITYWGVVDHFIPPEENNR